MRPGALAPYEDALRRSAPLGLRTLTGELITLDIARWLAGADAADATVLDRCVGPVLDIGCGPGRFVSSLAQRGVATLGVDIAESAVALTRGQGLPALLRDVFATLPGEGRWPTALLMDGNVGIGGDPPRLLRRVRGLLRPGGRLLVETHPDPAAREVLAVQFWSGGRAVGPVFEWAHVGRRVLHGYAVGAGYSVSELWSCDGRAFAVLTS
jgi:SAM-dependent methyltransferase